MIKMKKKNKATLNRGLFALPYVILALLFVIVPLVILLFRAFFNVNGDFTFNGFRVLGSWVNFKVLLYSLGIAALNTAICLVLAYPLAFVLASSNFNKYAVIVLLFVAPMWINFLLRTYALKTLLTVVGMRSGFWAMILGMVYDFFPFMLLPLYTVLANMDKYYVEASYDLGAPPLLTFVKITLPLSVPGIISGVLMTFMPTISAFAISDMLGGTILIFGGVVNRYFNRMSTWNAGAALAVVMLVLVFISVFISKAFSRKRSIKNPAATMGVPLK